MKAPLCHPERKHRSNGLCNACGQRVAYALLRAAGLPYWKASRRSVRGWAGVIQANRRWRHKHPEARKVQQRRWYLRQVQLYGGHAGSRFLPHLRRLEAKFALSAAAGKHVPVAGVSCVAVSYEPTRTEPYDSIRTRRGKGNPTLRYRVRGDKKVTRARSKKKPTEKREEK